MSLYDHDLLAQADAANEPCPTPVSQQADIWVRGLTTQEWGWVLAAADQRDERAYLEGGFR